MNSENSFSLWLNYTHINSLKTYQLNPQSVCAEKKFRIADEIKNQCWQI